MQKYIGSLLQIIKDAYESGVTLPEAEKYAAQFLHAESVVAEELKRIDLDARMKKTGLKAIKGAVYLNHATKTDKKPSDKMLEALVDSDPLIGESQNGVDTAEVDRDYIKNHLNIFHEAHIYFRGIAKGNFGG